MTGSSDRVKGKMLKLIKNDFLASARAIPIFYLIEAIALLCFTFGTKFNNGKLAGIGMAVSLVVAFLLIFVTFFFVVLDYQKSLFGQQGYLSLTLPVNSRQLLGSKIIVYGFWMILSYVVMILVYYYYITFAMNEYSEELDMADSMISMLTSGQYSIKFIIFVVCEYIAMFFVLLLSFLMLVYFSIAASNMRLFQKFNIIWAVVIFFISSGISIYLLTTCEKYLGVYLFFNLDTNAISFCLGDPEGNGEPVNLIPYIYYALQNVGCFFLTSYVMHKKVNIK